MVLEKRQTGWITLGLAGILILSLVAAGCIGNGPDSSSSNERTSIKVTGSTTVLPIAQMAAESYMGTHPTADIQVTGGGSSVGVQAAGEKTADIGMSSRDVKSDELTRYPDLVITTIGKDAVAIIVNPSNSITSLTTAQIKDIYAGNYTNWNQVGGPDMTIVVVGRDSASGTREYFTSSIMGETKYVRTMLEKNSNGAVKQTITQTPGAIGYVGLGFIDNRVKAVKIDTNGAVVEPTVDNVLSGEYPLSRSLYMITNGQPDGLAKAYLAFILSSEGQSMLAQEGFVPVK
ncbi:MAG: phosphate ABC transporter substrate-binding protein [Methanoregulaceae archaeon]|nr:phosphate ABC transporter substrate-binding protein [Methanoregulaceae archaeon]